MEQLSLIFNELKEPFLVSITLGSGSLLVGALATLYAPKGGHLDAFKIAGGKTMLITSLVAAGLFAINSGALHPISQVAGTVMLLALAIKGLLLNLSVKPVQQNISLR